MGTLFVIITLLVLHSGTSTSIESYVETKLIPKFENLTGHVSRILCSTDLKLISICYDKKSNSQIVNDLFRKTLDCVPGAFIKVIGLDPSNDRNIEAIGSQLIVIILNDQRLSQSIVRKMQSQRHRTCYIFIWDGEPPIEFQDYLSFIFLNYDILNAVTIVQRTTDTEFRILTHNPFTKQNIRIASNVYMRKELFIEKTMNVYGYPLLVTRYKSFMNFYVPLFELLHGRKSLTLHLDRFVPPLAASLMNATLNLSQPYRNEIDVEQIANADLLLNGRHYLPEQRKELRIEPTISLFRNDICVLVPYNRFRTMAESIMRTLGPYVWLCSVVTALSVVTSLFLISKMDRSYNRSNRPIRLHMFGNYTKYSRKFTSRLILTIWLLYCLIITSVFQSALYKGITLEGRDDKLTNINELLSKKYTILMYEAFFNETADLMKNSSLNGHIQVVSLKEYVDQIYTMKNKYAFVERLKRTNNFAKNVMHAHNNLPVYYTMQPCVRPLIETYYVRFGSPFLNRINWILRRSSESGLFRHWEKRVRNKHRKSQKLFQRPKSGSLQNLNFIFKYWFCALFLCVLVFIGECIVALLCRQPKFKQTVSSGHFIDLQFNYSD